MNYIQLEKLGEGTYASVFSASLFLLHFTLFVAFNDR